MVERLPIAIRDYYEAEGRAEDFFNLVKYASFIGTLASAGGIYLISDDFILAGLVGATAELARRVFNKAEGHYRTKKEKELREISATPHRPRLTVIK